jgi:7-cyano-7-deazaguanine synthase
MASESGSRVVPQRNATLLTVAANTGADRLIIGCNAEDQRDYLDCRPPFLEDMAAALGCIISAPLATYSKRQIVKVARRLGLARSDTWSCYLGGPVACGKCPSCIEADAAWAEG